MTTDSLASLTTPPEPFATPQGHRPVSGRRVRTVLAGAGYIAEYHLAILRENPAVDVVGACDPHPDRIDVVPGAMEPAARGDVADGACVGRAGGCRSHPHAAAHTRRGHPEALERGLHVLAEKPLALSLEDSDDARQLWRPAALRLDANHNAAWHPQFLRLKADIAARRLGAPSARRGDPERAAGAAGSRCARALDVREPRNVLFEQGPHPLSQICDLLGPVRARDRRSCTGRGRSGPGRRSTTTGRSRSTAPPARHSCTWPLTARSPTGSCTWSGRTRTARVDLLANTYVLDPATTSVPPVDAVRRGVASRMVGDGSDASRQIARYVGVDAALHASAATRTTSA